MPQDLRLPLSTIERFSTLRIFLRSITKQMLCELHEEISEHQGQEVGTGCGIDNDLPHLGQAERVRKKLGNLQALLKRQVLHKDWCAKLAGRFEVPSSATLALRIQSSSRRLAS